MLSRAVSRTHFKRADFAVLYVGGNDLDKREADPSKICEDITVRIRNPCVFQVHKGGNDVTLFILQALVVQLQRGVASAVFVFKVLPRCSASAVAESKRRALNRNLTRALKRMPDVFILNPEHKFLDALKKPKRFLLAVDGYHLNRFGGIKEMAEIMVKALSRKYGRSILLPGRPVLHRRYKVCQCGRCRAKGHSTGDCVAYCSPS
ncbi:uncharacterized protein LOC144161861 [Haemaphysalis longicornis]